MPQKGGRNYRRFAAAASSHSPQSEAKQPLSLEEKKKRTERIEREKPSMAFYRPPRFGGCFVVLVFFLLFHPLEL